MIISCPRCRLALDVGDRAPGITVHCRCTLSIVVPTPITAAGHLRCPGCGADVQKGDSACSYCKTRLATLLCASCFSANYLGNKHCAHCGVVLPDHCESIDGKSLPCPACNETLSRRALTDYAIEHCPSCYGVFLDRDTKHKLFAARKPQRTVSPPKRTATVSATQPVKYRRCPHCLTMMLRTNFGKTSGVIIDICREHGTWFDRNELAQCLQFVESGQFDAAQKRELEQLRQQAYDARVAATTGNTADNTGIPLGEMVMTDDGLDLLRSIAWFISDD